MMIFSHQCLIASQNILHPYKHIETILLKQQRPKSISPYSHSCAVIFVDTHKSESIYAPVNSSNSGKERESWKQWKCFESNFRICRQQFPFDLLDTKAV